jgi:hypothetical protein
VIAPFGFCVLAGSFWSPLARLTFAWYLMHPMWMDVLYDSSQSGIMYHLHLRICIVDDCSSPWLLLLKGLFDCRPFMSISNHHDRRHRSIIDR